jgi:hypothetical protein
VLQGEDGWLFLGADVSGACEPLLPLDETLAGLDRFGELVRRAGKTYVFTVAPDKSTMNPDKMPESYVGDDCAPEAKAAFWERMEDDPPVGYVDLKQELERVQEQDGENLWRPSDTHWAQRGALVYAQELAEALDPALWRTSRIVPTGPVELQADLAAQLGTPRTDTVPGWRLEREGVTVTDERATTLTATTTGAPLHTPSTADPRRLVHAELAVAAVAAVRLRADRAAGDRHRRPARAGVGGPVVRHGRARDRRAVRGRGRRPDHDEASLADLEAAPPLRPRPPPPEDGATRRATMTGRPRERGVCCSLPGRPGSVHAVSGVLLRAAVTIVESRSSSQRPERRPGAAAPSTCAWSSRPRRTRRSILLRPAPCPRADAQRFGMSWRLADVSERQRVVVMVASTRNCLNDLLFRNSVGELNLDVVAVVSNHPDLRATAEFYGVPFRHIPVTRETKPQAEASCSSSCAPSRSSSSCWPATCRSCPTACAASCGAGRSTSTTRCCRASRAPGPTTRPTTAA